MFKYYYVYILSSTSQKLYVGVTNNLERRTYEHKQGIASTFTKKYYIVKLVYYEVFNEIHQAIEREKQIKAYRRQKKITLIEENNPDWSDLSLEWFVD